MCLLIYVPGVHRPFATVWSSHDSEIWFTGLAQTQPLCTVLSSLLLSYAMHILCMVDAGAVYLTGPHVSVNLLPSSDVGSGVETVPLCVPSVEPEPTALP